MINCFLIKSSLAWLILAICFKGIAQGNLSPNPPMFLAVDVSFEEITQAQDLLLWEGRDSSVRHPLSLLSNENGDPQLFYAYIHTPVCIDGVCKPVYIDIYWDLRGNYVGYGVYPEELLTKYDHEPFTEADYEKLHRLLLDDNSILDRKQLSDLFDLNVVAAEKVSFQGVEVDAVSGATKKEISESVVEGALYSCYTLWHLVHGEVNSLIKNQLTSMYSPELAAHFLNSAYQPYHFYAIQQMDSASLNQSLPRLLEIFKDARPLTRTYLLKKLPKTLWKQKKLTEELYGMFDQLDVNTKTLLVDHLDYADRKALEILAFQIESMTKNQLKSYLSHLRDMPEEISATMLAEFRKVVDAQTYAYSYFLTPWMED